MEAAIQLKIESDPARVADHDIDTIFLERWSPRAFTREQLPERELLRMLEAARWAPSGNNLQPWRFFYALRDDAQWAEFMSLPSERNLRWCGEAAGILLVCSDQSSRTATFDAGCAWGFLSLQSASMGWATHAIGGFDQIRARELLRLPLNWKPEAMVAIGRRDAASNLPQDLREREKPSPRKPLGEITKAGRFES